MSNYKDGNKKVEIDMFFTEFEVPPIQDVLIVGKNAPIGPEAARRMIDILSPDQYDIIRIKHPYIEAIVLRKSLYRMLAQDRLIDLIVDESEKIMDENMLIKAHLDISLQITRVIDL